MWILELDVKSYFDSVNRKMLLEMLRQRVVDGSLLRLMGKCLHVGVLDGEEYFEPVRARCRARCCRLLLGNIYLHHVLDVWFERDVVPRLRGKAHLIRYADDGVIAFECEDDARRVMGVIAKRFERYGLKLHPEKTRVVRSSGPDGMTRWGRVQGPSISSGSRTYGAVLGGDTGSEAQDTTGAPPAVASCRRRVVPKPSASRCPRAARRAHTSHRWSLQLLRGEWQRAGAAVRRPSLRSGVAQMVEPKKPTIAT